MKSKYPKTTATNLVPVRQDLQVTTPTPANRRRYYLLLCVRGGPPNLDDARIACDHTLCRVR